MLSPRCDVAVVLVNLRRLWLLARDLQTWRQSTFLHGWEKDSQGPTPVGELLAVDVPFL